MAKQVIEAMITGKSGLLMNRHGLEPIEAMEKKEPSEQAEHVTYRDTEEYLICPSENLRSCLVGAAVYTKGKGRASLQKQAAAVISIHPEQMRFLDDVGDPFKDYVIDSRWAVNPTTKGKILKHRPLIREWKLDFQLEYDDRFFSDTQIREVVDNAGDLVGIMDYRPAKKGPFGRFNVTHWEKVKLVD